MDQAFVSRKVHTTHYSIKTWGLPQGNSHMKNWVFECSKSDKDDDWKILDSRKDQKCLDKSSAENTFEIQNKLEDNEYYRYIRIRLTGVNSRHTFQMVINSLELFGTIM